MNPNSNFYDFVQLMYFAQHKTKMLPASHHKPICDALTRVILGKTKRLIINVPPRSGKTLFVSQMFPSFCMGLNPASSFILTSYSKTLASNNTYMIRELMRHEVYQSIFSDTQPVIKDDSQARDEFRTDSGGMVYGVGAGGTITGKGAGAMGDMFSGCFSYDTLVDTERGLMKIGDIVENEIDVRVWSLSDSGEKTLEGIDGYIKNPPEKLIDVHLSDGDKIRCTPWHEILTLNRGWVRADSLTAVDSLPSVDSAIKTLDAVSVPTKSPGDSRGASAIISGYSIFPAPQRMFNLLLGKNRAEVGCSSPVFSNRLATSDRLPCIASPYLINNHCGNAVLDAKSLCGNADSVINSQSVGVAQNGIRMNFGLAKRAMHHAILDVVRSSVVPKVFKSVIGRVAIMVANIQALWFFPNMRKHDKRVDKSPLDFTAIGKRYAQVAAFCWHWLKQSTLSFIQLSKRACNNPVEALDPPEVADHVGALKARDRKPVFISAVNGVHNSYCLTVNPYNNFTIQQGIVVKNCILIDDISKPNDALSETMRASTIEWFRGTLESRKNSPDTPIIIVMQRLHEQDLSGWLLDGGNGEEWELLKIPALREDGSSFWPKQFPLDMLERLEKSNPFTFAGQYQQEPSPRGGGFFKPSNIEIIEALPADIKWVRGWDLAATAKGGDYTVGAKVGVKDGITYIADIRREQGSPDEVERLIVQTAKTDGCLQSIPQDPGAAGKSVVSYLSKKLAGTRFKFSQETGDKATRAEPVAAQINVGNVKMIKAEWNEVLTHELASFPMGAHDDIVDAMSRSYNELLSGSGYSLKNL